MAFDQKTRNLLQRTVTACRRVLDREFTAQLQELYGIQPDGLLTPIAALDHLGDEELDVARLLRERINHLEGGSAAESFTRTAAKPEHIARVIREQAFTVLNRLAALRLCEERELVLECVRKGVNSEGFQLFLSSAGNALGSTHEAYQAYLHCLFDELAIDLGVLFDRFSPLALLFPRHAALTEVLSELNGSGKAAEREALPPEQFAEIWQADETIGWIYQYYNDEAERKKMREESAAPRNSRELAVRNQFFTPRYVVEFLIDNTLGRIWDEMSGGATSLKEKCRYLVRRPNEIFLKPGQNPPAPTMSSAAKDSPSPPSEGGEGRGEVGSSLSQEDLLKQPVFIPHRPLKDPRTILMLDPACGSMHFGLYAFDLFEVIYDEAWALEERLGADALSRPPGVKSLHATYAGKDAFLKDVPRLIIEHNLHGIDIDPRCAQIAGLSLWLRAQRAWKDMGIAPAQRPAIKRSNIVCAEPMPGEKELLREFVEREFPAAERAVCLRLLEAIFDKMQLAGEAGSLLKIEEEIRSAIEDARDAWQKLATRPPELFTTTELNQLSTAPELTGLEQAVSSLTTAPRHLTTDFWERIEERIHAALRDYAEQAENGGGFQRRLFAEDAARGFAFIDVCRKRYEVVLMNPPFGESASDAKDYIEKRYPQSSADLFAAFVDRAVTDSAANGFVGVISTEAGFFRRTLESWRKSVLLQRSTMSVMAHFGGHVLDGATVRTASYVLGTPRTATPSLFLRLIGQDGREERLIESISDIQSGASRSGIIFQTDQSEFEKLPYAVFGYWCSRQLRNAFVELPKVEGNSHVRQGLVTGDDFRFLRIRWEVPQGHIGIGKSWVLFAKGGEYSPYHDDVHLVLNWQNDGIELVVCGLGRPQNIQFFGKAGLTYPLRTNKRIAPRVMPAGCAFGHKGPGIFDVKGSSFALLATLNSAPLSYMAGLILGASEAEGGAGANSYEVGVVQRLPLPSTALADPVLQSNGERAWRCRASGDLRDEVTGVFSSPFAFLSSVQSLSAVAKAISENEIRLAEDYKQCQRTVDDRVCELFRFSSADRGDIEQQAGDVHAPLVASGEDASFRASVALDSIQYGLGCVIGRWDIRYATGEQAAPELPDPFAPLPVCPPGQLQNAQGLPARPEDVPAGYPVRIPWDGILVDDPNHPLDIERRVREVIEIIWSGKDGGPTAEAIEHEACEILGVKSLRDYFRKPAGFFADHLKRYSKSRRQAPIYWPLSTASGSYTLWIYYHRLTPDTLYKCVQQFVNPKLADVEKELTHLRTVLAANEGGAKERKRLEELEDLRRELIELRTELELWAPKWKPNLNDGVLITAAPLWKLFRLPKWQKDLKACWLDLEKGDYDWAHLAHTLWPDRVREKCKTDRSLAIAHGLEDVCEVKVPMKKARKRKKTDTELELSHD